MILSVLPCALAAPGRRIPPTPASLPCEPPPGSGRRRHSASPPAPPTVKAPSPCVHAGRASLPTRERGTARRLGEEAGAAWAAPRGRSAAGALPPLELPLERVARAEEDQVGGGV